MEVPLGFRFLPEPFECIEYLRYKVMGYLLPYNGIIFDLSPYNLKQLPDIFSATESKGDLYLFTKLSKKGKIGSTNINRRVGKGTWHGNKTQNVRDRNGGLIGKSFHLSYQEKGSINDKRFLMTEYTLLKQTSLHYDPLKDYVLCHLYKNPRWKNRQRLHNPSNQEHAVLQTPSPAATESISSVVEVEMELPTDLPSTTASNPLYVEPLAIEAAHSQASDENALAGDILDAFLPTDFDIDICYHDPSWNDCFELMNGTDF